MESTFFTNLLLLAENEGGNAPLGGVMGGMLFPFLAIGFLFYFLIIRPQRQERARHQAMLAAVKKNDRVIVAGGIYGVVANVNAKAKEITIKVDETTNTKLRLTLSSLITVLGDEASDDKAPQN